MTNRWKDCPVCGEPEPACDLVRRPECAEEVRKRDRDAKVRSHVELDRTIEEIESGDR